MERIDYRADGQLDRLQYGNGTVEQRGYDGYGRLSRQTLSASHGPVLQQFDYQRDANGNLTQRHSQGLAQFPALTASYRYDSLDRLTQERYDLLPERNADYSFDPNGNWLTRQQGVNGAEADEIYSYAAKSNRLVDKDALMQADATPEPVKDVTYDAKQRVRTLSVGGQLTAEYRYDARNLRTKKTLYDDAGAVSVEVYYHYDANGLLIGESDAQGLLRREYVYLGMMPVAQIDIDAQGQERVVYFLTDQLATPRLGIDQGQAVVWKWESDAYGSIAPSGSVTVNLRFAGQYFDAESGWFYNWNRYYLPKEGRYLTSDPIGVKGGLNTYTYVSGNPVNFADPLGLEPDDGDNAAEWCRKKCAKDGFCPNYGVSIPLPNGDEVQLCDCDQKCPLDEADASSKKVTDKMSDPEFLKDVKDIRWTDCDDLAKRLYKASEGNGKVLDLTKPKGMIKVPELGEVQDFYDHRVFTDDNYIYDPRYSTEPVPYQQYIDQINDLNPGGIIIKEVPQ